MGENKLHEIRYLCEIITPMFLGDHSGRGAELRPPSIKGAMRFWWRATHSYTSIAALKTAEGNIFGTPEGEGKKSKVLITARLLYSHKSFLNIKELKIFENPDDEGKKSAEPVIARDLSRTPPTNKNLPPKPNLKVIRNGREIDADSIKYLAFGKTSSGSVERNNLVPQAFYFEPGTQFEVVFLTPREHIDSVNEVFHLVAYYGGLGGKSRNGFGSFRILDTEGASPFTAFSEFHTGFDSKLPDYPAFSTYTEEIHSGQTYNEWKDAMGALGKAYFEAKNELGRTASSKYSLIPNKKEYLGIIRGSQIKKGDLKLPREQKFERIAKPYFFRIDKTADNKFKIRVLFLPSKFLEGFRNTQNDTLLKDSQDEYLKLLKIMTKTLSDNLKGGSN